MHSDPLSNPHHRPDVPGSAPTLDAAAPLLSGGSHDRRTFLKLLGLSVAAGALSGCRPPREKIVPHLQAPPEMTPGVANWYATTCHGCPAACGALVKVLDGRPIKLEGNPEHVISRGGLCAVGQGAIAGLYDPYRQRRPTHKGSPSDFAAADTEIVRRLNAARAGGGQVVVMTGGAVGPATRALIREFLAGFPNGRHIVLDRPPMAAVRDGYRTACGLDAVPAMRFDRAQTIVSFGADFLGTWLSPVEFTKQYAAARSTAHPPRHLQVEARMSLTGANADERFVLSPSEQACCAAAVLASVARKLGGEAAQMAAGIAAQSYSAGVAAAAERITEALLESRARSLVVSGSDDPAIQTIVAALNGVLGSIGTTLDPVRAFWSGGSDADVVRLVSDMQAGKVAALIVHGCNPVHVWPQRDEFVRGLQKVACSVSTATVPDETARGVEWHLPASHPMESWGDAEPQAGIFSVRQPTIRPLYRTRALEDSLLAWMGRPPDFHAYLQNHWRTHVHPRAGRGQPFDAFWDEALQQGCVVVAPTGRATATLHGSAVASCLHAVASVSTPADGYEVELHETVSLHDGEWANNPWLQELPDPVTKVTWGAGAALAASTAASLGLEDGDWLAVSSASGRVIEMPVLIQPGQHPRTISIPLGYGRLHGGPIAAGVGVDAYPLVNLTGGRRAHASAGASVRAAQGRSRFGFARTQRHDRMEGRDLVRDEAHGTAGQHGHADYDAEQRRANLWGAPIPSDRQWGMVIDLDRCVGCSACVTACDIENNVPAVGADEVSRSREMHWMRLDRYYEGDPDNPRVRLQPMLCQHCANASCESVCPALATVHDDQGLNVQVYNRCVGTRYCANNCPYKVRRFNWFDNQAKLAVRRLGLNPSVTVRSRGVMEKCSFCLQRIQEARIRARNEGREVRDGEVRTACEQSCPADAIVFGDLQDPRSRVSRLAADPRAYRVLEELNRQPAVRYLARSARPGSSSSTDHEGGV